MKYISISLLLSLQVTAYGQDIRFNSYYISTEGAGDGTITQVKGDPQKYTGAVVEWQFRLFKKGEAASITSKGHKGLISSKTLAGATKRLKDCQWIDKAYAKFFSLNHDQTCDCCNYIGPIAKLSYIRTSDKVIENFQTALNFEDWAESELNDRFNAKQLIMAVSRELLTAGTYKGGDGLKNYVRLLKSSKDNLNALQYKISSFNYDNWMQVESDMLIVYGDISELKKTEATFQSATPSPSEPLKSSGSIYRKTWKNKLGSTVTVDMTLTNGKLSSTFVESYIRNGVRNTATMSYSVPLGELQKELAAQKKKISFDKTHTWQNGFYMYLNVPSSVITSLSAKGHFGVFEHKENQTVKQRENNLSINIWAQTEEELKAIKELLCSKVKLCE